ncbi:apses-domain-containing protein [Conidiobolus coronatus NRRL 28638]|uniref:Apses-domain-containing protein n=1 Tax=Conidiobolus coronatus (strain ATCC 28846 / CBS 209.66 / NRRL 28638) TaxID=796925 RepID=A0A137NPD5_CONC2|nr:apses-domain-containing protein [Conidiobolus coronatus NRRL 28638]|eukprot:KXN64592.1 apses-domain-containing protein [Conidiobolus coronatus NRRL 28638]
MYNLVSAPVVQSHYHQISDNSRYHPYQSRPSQANSYQSSMNTSSSSGASHIMDPFSLPPYCMPGAYDTRPATLTTIQWEDEKTFCYLVEIKGVSVGRRKDNNMINGTKLLNLSGMTRGKRDGILKSELERSVIKSGLMVLKGVWISFERAKELAKEYGVYDLIHPLLEWDIESYYYRSILDVSPPHPLGNNDHRWFMPFPAPIKALPPHQGQKLPVQYYNLPPCLTIVTVLI